jgi:outer membrane immunogenic protein
MRAIPGHGLLHHVDRRFEIRSNIVRNLVYSNVFKSSIFTSSIFWAVAAALLGGPTDATAADLALKMPVKAPVAAVAEPIYSWTGWYGGLSGGYGSGHSDPGAVITPGSFPLPAGFELDPLVPQPRSIADPDVKGWLFGGQLGYNFQVDRAVFGVESDISWANIGGSRDGAPFSLRIDNDGDGGRIDAAGRVATKLDWFGTVRGRFGYALDRFMPYVTGGLAYGDIKTTVSATGSQFDTGVTPARLIATSNIAASTSSVHVGYALGAGLDWAVTERWMLRAEYMYLNFGRGSAFGIAPITASDSGMNVNLVRGALNYRF